MRNFTAKQVLLKSCPRSFIISISRVWMDHSSIMDGDCLSVQFRAHIVFKLSSLPSTRDAFTSYIIVSWARLDILSQIHHIGTNKYSVCGVGTARRKVYTHFLPVLCVVVVVVVVGLFVRCQWGDDVQT